MKNVFPLIILALSIGLVNVPGAGGDFEENHYRGPDFGLNLA